MSEPQPLLACLSQIWARLAHIWARHANNWRVSNINIISEARQITTPKIMNTTKILYSPIIGEFRQLLASNRKYTNLMYWRVELANILACLANKLAC